MAASTPCKPCVPGEFATAGTTICVQCKSGTRDEDIDPSTPCVICASGSYSRAGQKTCASCTAGFADSDADASTPCVKCGPGNHTSPGATRCTLCGPGTADKDFEAGTSCTPCSPGQYSAPGQTSCNDCTPGRADTDGDSSTPCERCPAELYSERAHVGSCLSCPAGKQLNGIGNGCTLCEPGTYRDHSVARCKECKVGQFMTGRGALSCEVCPDGMTTTDARSTHCECEIGRYSSVAHTNGSCMPCSSLTLPMPLFTAPPNLYDPALCPGGPEGDAPVCPMEGLWVHHNLNKVELFACENALACPGVTNCSEWLVSRVASATARRSLAAGSLGGRDDTTMNSCGANNEGLLCAKCKAGYSKVKGKCVSCEGADYRMLMLQFLSLFVSAFLLLVKAGKPDLSRDDMHHLLHRLELGSGSLREADIKHILTIVHYDKTDDDISELIEKQGDITTREREISVSDFLRWWHEEAPSASVKVGVFFAQTTALIGKDSQIQYLGALELLNLDVESTAGSCVLPENATRHFYRSCLSQLVGLYIFAYLVYVLINLIAPRAPPSAVEGKQGSKPALTAFQEVASKLHDKIPILRNRRLPTIQIYRAFVLVPMITVGGTCPLRAHVGHERDRQ